MDNLIANVREKLPKVVTVQYGLRAWIEDYKRDNIPVSVKQDIARACYQSDTPQAVFYDKVFTYKQFDNNKYKLV